MERYCYGARGMGRPKLLIPTTSYMRDIAIESSGGDVAITFKETAPVTMAFHINTTRSRA